MEVRFSSVVSMSCTAAVLASAFCCVSRNALWRLSTQDTISMTQFLIDSRPSMMQSAWVCMSVPILIKPSNGSTKVSISTMAMHSA